MRIFGLLLLCCVVLSGLTGCVTRHGDFTVLSNKLVRLSEFELDHAERKRGIVGKEVSHIILIFPTMVQPSLEGALDDAFDQADGDVMTDAVVESWQWYIPYIYGQIGWSVKGDVIKTRRN